MQVELIELHRKIALTTVLVTHDQEEALSLADLVVLMRQGRVEQVGAPREIYRNPATAFAASFIGAANLIPVRLANGQAEIAPGLSVPAPAGEGRRLLLLRQEDLSLRAAALPAEIAVPVSVVAIAYHGAQCHAVVDLAGLRVALLLPADAGGFERGARALLCWAADKARLLPVTD